MTECFLGSDHRISKAAAYSNAGLLSSVGTKVASMDSGFNNHYKDDTRSVGNKNNDNENDNDSSEHNAGDLSVAKTVSGSGKPLLSGRSSSTSRSIAIDVPAHMPVMANPSTATARAPVSINASRKRAYGRSIP